MDAPAVGVFNAVTAEFYRLTPNGPSLGNQITRCSGNNVSGPAVVTALANTSIIDPNTIIDVTKHLDSNGNLHCAPSNGTDTVNWGGNLASDFEEYRGHSILPWLLSATGRILESAEATEQFLFDLRLTHAHLTATKSYGYFAQHLGKHGIALLPEPYGDGLFDGMEIAVQVTYAYGEYWAHNTYGSDGYTEIGTSSGDFKTTAVRGVNFKESFTGQPVSSAHTEHPYQPKVQGDREMSLGTNSFYCHSYSLRPVEAAWPGMMFGPFGSHFDRHSTWTNQSTA